MEILSSVLYSLNNRRRVLQKKLDNLSLRSNSRNLKEIKDLIEKISEIDLKLEKIENSVINRLED